MSSIDLSEIDAYLFDLGGVVININPQATIEAFASMGLPNLKEQINLGHHHGLFEEFEMGKINNSTFVERILQQIPATVLESEVVDAWNQMLVRFPEERIKILENLKRSNPVYLLSNTNGIHREKFTKMAQGYESIEELFTEVFYSYQLGCSKPSKEPFLKVIEKTGLNPERTLFLDDAQANIDTAKKLGFKTVLVSNDYSIENIFGEFLW
jgi:putative hydrolase of the HAD superfamily